MFTFYFILEGSEPLIPTSGSNCLTCKCDLSERDQQVNHYRGDWHRYNLKLRLLGQPAVSEEEFVALEGKSYEICGCFIY